MFNINLDGVVLETERLYLRAFVQSDLKDFNEFASVEGAHELAGWKHHASLAETQDILDKFISEKNVFAVILKSTGKIVGELRLYQAFRIKEDKNCAGLRGLEIGYVLSESCWGRGLMPEAVQAVMTYCFDVLSLDVLVCTHALDNPRSKRIIEKGGFKYVEPAKVYFEASKECKDGSLYLLFKNEWRDCK